MKKTEQILQQNEICINVFGKQNSGKSTLLNALLGDE